MTNEIDTFIAKFIIPAHQENKYLKIQMNESDVYLKINSFDIEKYICDECKNTRHIIELQGWSYHNDCPEDNNYDKAYKIICMYIEPMTCECFDEYQGDDTHVQRGEYLISEYIDDRKLCVIKHYVQKSDFSIVSSLPT